MVVGWGSSLARVLLPYPSFLTCWRVPSSSNLSIMPSDPERCSSTMSKWQANSPISLVQVLPSLQIGGWLHSCRVIGPDSHIVVPRGPKRLVMVQRAEPIDRPFLLLVTSLLPAAAHPLPLSLLFGPADSITLSFAPSSPCTPAHFLCQFSIDIHPRISFSSYTAQRSSRQAAPSPANRFRATTRHGTARAAPITKS